MGYKYAKEGPPFNFLGHMSESQKKRFYEWIDKRLPLFTEIEDWFRIRAHQLRKTAGILEKYYKEKHDEKLEPSFEKESWKPGGDGHFTYKYRDDQHPSVTTYRIKDYFIPQLQRDDEGVFFMNYVRNVIEKMEDQAQHSHEAAEKVAKLKQELDGLFSQPEYQAVLVKDQSDTYKGEPRYRVHQLDEPTAWEKEIHNLGEGKIILKEQS